MRTTDNKLLLYVVVICGTGVFSPNHCGGQDAEDTEKKAWLSRLAQSFEIQVQGAEEKAACSKTTMLSYSNPERLTGSTHGATHFWLVDGRPIAAASFSLRRPKDRVYYEFASLTSLPMTASRNSEVVWNPMATKEQATFSDGMEIPAALPARRLLQMRSLARSFSASCERRGVETKLRLLPSPIFRFSSEDSESTDGAVFAFVTSNDPELLLLLQANDINNKESRWTYHLSQMTSLEVNVMLDGSAVWNAENYYRTRTKTGPYIEGALGYFPAEELQVPVP